MAKGAAKKAARPLEHVFWRAQIGVLRACPPLCGVAARVSLGAPNSKAVWVKTLVQVAAQTPRALARHWRDRREGRAVLPRVTVFVTLRCTLNCDKCAAHVPNRRERRDCRDIPADKLIADIRALLERVDQIYVIYLTGGEPFLHPDLGEIIQACAASGKVNGINIATNGTVVPGEKTLAALRDPKVSVKISNYGAALQPGVERLKKALRANGTEFSHESGTAWSDMGGDGRLMGGSARRRFSVCSEQLCTPLYRGRLHVCGESALWAEEGLIPEGGDFIDVRAADPAQFREELRALRKKRVLSACAYCLGNTYRTPRVPVAQQREVHNTDA